MRRALWTIPIVAVFALTLSLPAGAVPDAATQGFYEGKFTSGSNAPLLVQVVALQRLPNDKIARNYKLVFLPAKEGVTSRIEVPGVSDNTKVTFQGTAGQGAPADGPCKVTAELTGDTLTGAFAGKETVAFTAKRVDRASPTLGEKPPAGAIVLFDGANLDNWERIPPKWNLIPDQACMEVASHGSLVTKQEHGDCQMHVEFRTPFKPDEELGGQGRGNSGVYVLGRYEVQVLDSFGVEPQDNLCGGIYKVAKPIAEACGPPESWQTYDITFTAARFDGGKKTTNARITVKHNGIVIHDNLELAAPTPGGVSGDDAATGPLLLQDHGNSVRYRNIWVLEKR